MKELKFSQNGVCRILFSGVPEPEEIEELIEDYVTQVEFLPHRLQIIYLDISGLKHLGARSRQVFSELITQASTRYKDQIKMVVAGGSLSLRRFIELFCKGIGFYERSVFFESNQDAEHWISKYLTK